MTTGPGGRDDTLEGVPNQRHTSEATLSGEAPQAGARTASPVEGVLNQRHTSEARLSGEAPTASLPEGVLNPNDRRGEWFVPNFGPARFRSVVGLLFLPYTGMVLSFSVIGSILARSIDWNRVAAVVIIYFLGLGIGAHALDALGSKGNKPWGEAFTKSELWLIAVVSLVSAYAIAVYYMVRHVPFLCTVAILEGFFVFAYNLEWFQGKFHSDLWFAFSWGFLPVMAGAIMQTNSVSAGACALGISMALFSLVEIKASRPYKELTQRPGPPGDEERSMLTRYEIILKCVSLGVILLAGGLLIWRLSA